MVPSQESGDRNVSSENGQQRVNPQSEIALPQGARSIPSIVGNNEVSGSDDMACDLVLSQSSLPENHLLGPNSPSHELSPVESGSDTPSIVRERVLQDGYSWRKYGQKQVKGSEFKRCYYRCTYPDCQAKKYLQLTNDENIKDCICIGEHNHPHPQSNNVPPVDRVLPVAEQEPEQSSLVNVEAQQIAPLSFFRPSLVSGTDELNATKAKRQKRDNNNNYDTGADVSSGKSRPVVKPRRKVENVNDGYRWCKYGQKMVKGNLEPYPRSYFRCWSPGCPVKKQVEGSSQEAEQLVVRYEGQHDHEPPNGSGVPRNTAKNTQITSINGNLVNSSGRNTVCDDMFPFRVVILPNHALEDNLNEEEQENEEAGTKEDSGSDA